VISFLSGVGLAGLNLAGLSFFVSRLGQAPRTSALLSYVFLIFLKWGLTGLALVWLIRSPWFRWQGLFAGLAMPMLVLLTWQVLKLKQV
jgi:hypothetical protein